MELYENFLLSSHHQMLEIVVLKIYYFMLRELVIRLFRILHFYVYM
jgi:hypothetical protein